MKELGIVLCSTGQNMAERARDADFIVLSLSRAEIERGLVGDAVDRLMTLSDSRHFTERFASGVALQVTGFENDPRELYEIPACRTYFRDLVAQWNGWLHFLEKDGGSLQVLVCQLLDVEVQRREAGMVGARMKDPADMTRVLCRLLEGLNALYALHRIGKRQNEIMTDHAISTVMRYFGEI